MINLNHRAISLTIGGVDYSAQSNGGELDVAFLEDAGGLAWVSGVINLSAGVLPINEDATPGLFEEGTAISLSLDDGTSALRPFPHALRCLRPSYYKGKQKLRVGDVFALGDRKPNTSFLAAQAVPGIALSSRTVIERWAAAGFDLSNFDWQTSREFYFGWPLEVVGGNYREAISALLNSLGCKGWVNAQETFVIADVTPKATSPLFSVNADLEARKFEPVELGDRPAEKLIVTGTYNDVGRRDNSVTSISESEDSGGNTIKRTTHVDAYNYSSDVRTVTETEDIDGDVLYAPLVEAGENLPTGALTEARESVAVWDYENGDDGKLLTIDTTIKERRILNMPSYLGWQAQDGSVNAGLWNDYLDPAKIEEVVFTYDSRERLIKRVEEHQETIGAVLSPLGSILQWGDFTNLGTGFQGLQASYRKTETWLYEGKEVRDYQIKEEQVASRDANSQATIKALLEGNTPQNGINLARELIDLDQRDRGRGGSLSAPATQRKPPSQYYPEPVQLQREYDFASFASNWADKEENITMDYLPDEGSLGGLQLGQQITSPEAAMDIFGDIAGHLLKASVKARQLEAPLFPALLTNYQPWAVVDITQEGLVRRVALDGLKVSWTNQSTMITAVCPCLGTVVNGSLVLPYNPA